MSGTMFRSTPGALLTREECSWWQRRVEAAVGARERPDRLLEVALAAIQYAAEGVPQDEAIRLAADLILGEHGLPHPSSRRNRRSAPD